MNFHLYVASEIWAGNSVDAQSEKENRHDIFHFGGDVFLGRLWSQDEKILKIWSIEGFYTQQKKLLSYLREQYIDNKLTMV